MLRGQQRIHLSMRSYQSCTLCPFSAFSCNSLSQAEDSSFRHLGVFAEAISFSGKQLSDFHSSLCIVNPSTEQLYAKLKETEWCTTWSQNWRALEDRGGHLSVPVSRWDSWRQDGCFWTEAEVRVSCWLLCFSSLQTESQFLSLWVFTNHISEKRIAENSLLDTLVLFSFTKVQPQHN